MPLVDLSPLVNLTNKIFENVKQGLDINGNLEVLLLILGERMFFGVFEVSFIKRVIETIDKNEDELYQEVNL